MQNMNEEVQKISLAIIGAQKAGTTSLKNYLSEHPEISTHHSIEFDYFINDDLYLEGFASALKRFFPTRRSDTLIAKHISLLSNEKSLRRLMEHNKKCKLVVILREPISRAFSSYQMEKLNGKKEPFSQIVSVLEKNDTDHYFYRFFIELGLYAKHLNLVFKYFPKNQVRILLYEELKDDSPKICREIFAWLGVNDNFQPNTSKVHNKASSERSALLGSITNGLRRESNLVRRFLRNVLPYSVFLKIGQLFVKINRKSIRKETIDSETLSYLKNFFREKNKELEQLTSIDISHWSK